MKNKLFNIKKLFRKIYEPYFNSINDQKSKEEQTNRLQSQNIIPKDIKQSSVNDENNRKRSTSKISQKIESKTKERAAGIDNLYFKLKGSLGNFINENKKDIILRGTKRYEGRTGEYYFKTNQIEKQLNKKSNKNNSIKDQFTISPSSSSKRISNHYFSRNRLMNKNPSPKTLTPIPFIRKRNIKNFAIMRHYNEAERTAVHIRRLEYSTTFGKMKYRNENKNKNSFNEIDVLIIRIQRRFRRFLLEKCASIIIQSRWKGYFYRKRFRRNTPINNRFINIYLGKKVLGKLFKRCFYRKFLCSLANKSKNNEKSNQNGIKFLCLLKILKKIFIKQRKIIFEQLKQKKRKDLRTLLNLNKEYFILKLTNILGDINKFNNTKKSSLNDFTESIFEQKTDFSINRTKFAVNLKKDLNASNGYEYMSCDNSILNDINSLEPQKEINIKKIKQDYFNNMEKLEYKTRKQSYSKEPVIKTKSRRFSEFNKEMNEKNNKLKESRKKSILLLKNFYNFKNPDPYRFSFNINPALLDIKDNDNINQKILNLFEIAKGNKDDNEKQQREYNSCPENHDSDYSLTSFDSNSNESIYSMKEKHLKFEEIKITTNTKIEQLIENIKINDKVKYEAKLLQDEENEEDLSERIRRSTIMKTEGFDIKKRIAEVENLLRKVIHNKHKRFLVNNSLSPLKMFKQFELNKELTNELNTYSMKKLHYFLDINNEEIKENCDSEENIINLLRRNKSQLRGSCTSFLEDEKKNEYDYLFTNGDYKLIIKALSAQKFLKKKFNSIGGYFNRWKRFGLSRNNYIINKQRNKVEFTKIPTYQIIVNEDFSNNGVLSIILFRIIERKRKEKILFGHFDQMRKYFKKWQIKSFSKNYLNDTIKLNWKKSFNHNIYVHNYKINEYIQKFINKYNSVYINWDKNKNIIKNLIILANKVNKLKYFSLWFEKILVNSKVINTRREPKITNFKFRGNIIKTRNNEKIQETLSFKRVNLTWKLFVNIIRKIIFSKLKSHIYKESNPFKDFINKRMTKLFINRLMICGKRMNKFFKLCYFLNILKMNLEATSHFYKLNIIKQWQLFAKLQKLERNKLKKFEEYSESLNIKITNEMIGNSEQSLFSQLFDYYSKNLSNTNNK